MTESSAITPRAGRALGVTGSDRHERRRTGRLSGDLTTILSNVARVNEAAGEDVPATSHPIALTNVMRSDEVGPTLSDRAGARRRPGLRR